MGYFVFKQGNVPVASTFKILSVKDECSRVVVAAAVDFKSITDREYGKFAYTKFTDGAWIVLISASCGVAPMSGASARVVLPLLVLPTVVGPVLAWGLTTGDEYYPAFTALMQWGIFPVVVLVLLMCAVALVRARVAGMQLRQLYPVEFTGFATSAVLTVAGFVLGAFVNGQTTAITAHYHAAIGGVTVSFMALALMLLESYGWHVRSPLLRRLAPLQPVFFGIGQFTLALGLSIASLGRKIYGAEQVVRTPAQKAGMIIMGAGGFFAICGGVLFVVLVVSAWRGQRSGQAPTSRQPCGGNDAAT